MNHKIELSSYLSYTGLKKSYIILLIASAAVFAGCHKDSDLPAEDMGYGYFPANTGHWVTYLVDSTAWDDFNDTVYYYNYQIKEVIESEFMDNEGRNTLRIERYKRLTDTNAWIIKDVWFANLTSSTAERVEENERFVKLIFPVREGEQWNGNVYNTLGEENYTFTDVHSPYSVSQFFFDSSLTVKQFDEQNLIMRRQSIEVYAKDIGLIYKKYIDIKTHPTGVTYQGTDYSYSVLAWGD
jgi:hypothetical protein